MKFERSFFYTVGVTLQSYAYKQESRKRNGFHCLHNQNNDTAAVLWESQVGGYLGISFPVWKVPSGALSDPNRSSI